MSNGDNQEQSQDKSAEPEQVELHFERLVLKGEVGRNLSASRAAIPNGWLVVFKESMVFVPDRFHEWTPGQQYQTEIWRQRQ